MTSAIDCDSANKCANFFNTIQKPFPSVENGKINTREFIDAARGVVTLVEKLGSVFTPVKYDMNGNVEKILKRYDADIIKNETLNDLVLSEKAEKGNLATDALLWLTRLTEQEAKFNGCTLDNPTQKQQAHKTTHQKIPTSKTEHSPAWTLSILTQKRALHLIELFLEQIMLNRTEENNSENLQKELTHAYSLSVKPYHGWVTQKIFSVLCQMCPTRSQLFISLGIADDDGFNVLEDFINRLRTNRSEIQCFYAIHKLDNNLIV